MTAPIEINVPYTTLLLGWGVLLGVACLLLATIGGIAWLQRRRAPASGAGAPADVPVTGVGARIPRRRPTAAQCAALRAEAEELAREAAAAGVKAAQAQAEYAAAAARHGQAQQARDAAAVELDATQREYRVGLERRRAGAGAPPAPRPRTGDERQLERAALAAYRRGDLSVDELREVFRRAGGWDPVREELEHEVGRLRAQAQAAHRAYDAAAAALRVAAKAASIAEVAATALADEAVEEAEEARLAHEAVEDCARRSRRSLIRRSAASFDA